MSSTLEDNALLFVLTEDVLIDKEYLHPFEDEGAKVCFKGYVRCDNPYKNVLQVKAIEYHCYDELARKEGFRILQEARMQYGVTRIFCIHRIGLVLLQEASIQLEITSKHRINAFHAAESIMKNIKEFAPIWKQEITHAGEKIWT